MKFKGIVRVLLCSSAIALCVEPCAAQDAQARREEINDQIETLQNDIEQHENAAEQWNNTLENLSNSGCSGLASMLCQGIGQIGVAKARSNANKETEAANQDRAEIRRLQHVYASIRDPEPQPLPPPEPIAPPPTPPVVMMKADLVTTSAMPPSVPSTAQPMPALTNLKEASAFIQEQLTRVGQLTYTLTSSDSRNGAKLDKDFFVLIDNVQFQIYKKPNLGTQCLLSYHDQETENSETIENRDLGVLLNDIEELSVTPLKVLDQKIYPTREIRVSPAIFRIDIRTADGGDNFLFFADEGAATYVASAITQAVDLCNSADTKR